jgi:hypothetical protein
LVDAPRAPGYYIEQWDGKNKSGSRVAMGIYFCRLQAGNYTETKRMLVLK